MLTGLIPLILGLGLIGFGIFIKIKDISFKKEAVPTKFLIKKVEVIQGNNIDEGTVIREYRTTFEFEYNGVLKEQVMTIPKKFDEGSIKNGLYLEKNGKGIISVAGQGFYLAKGGEVVLIAFGIVFLLYHYILYLIFL
ncbi:MAG: hypothetical protein ILA19_03770 [Bacilli bacterium]|nr:hypothetical protein [Bacilli bacterium]